MAGWPIIEEESGTTSAWVHPHNGYHAGDFWGPKSETSTSKPGW